MKNKNKKAYVMFKGQRKYVAGIFLVIVITLLLSAFAVSCIRVDKEIPEMASDEFKEPATDLEGKQIIEITASGGYYPESVDAKAGIQSILRIKSDNAYGCERAFRIPALGVSETLPINGFTDIALGSQQKGTTILGTCSMGMYTFNIFFN